MKTKLHSAFYILPAAFLLLTATPRAAAQTDAFNPGASSYVYSLAVQADGKILVGGSFSTLGGSSRSHIARLNADGTLDSSFNPGASSAVYSLTVQADGKIVVGGDFTTLGGQSRSRIGRLNADGTLDTTFNPGAGSSVYCLAVQTNGQILVGGAFATLGGQSRSQIGRLNADGTVDATFNPGAGSSVYCLAVQTDGKILVGGTFSGSLGGQVRSRIGRLNADGTPDSSFSPVASGAVYSLAVQANRKILVGGDFTTLGGQSRSRIGRLNADATGTADSGFNPGADSTVLSLAVQADGKILVGGGFTTLGGQSRNRIGRLNADGSLDTTFNPPNGADSTVCSLAAQADGKVLVGGYFTTLGGQSRGYLGRLDTGEPATQSLSLAGTTVTWLRGGTSPEVWRTTFEEWTGTAWTSLGAGTRSAGGWQLTGVSLPANFSVRARGYTAGGQYNASGGLVETVLDRTPPSITGPANVTVNAEAGQCSASGVALGTPVTSDDCGMAGVTSNAPALFPAGTTTVTWTATDTNGNTSTSAQLVVVRDTQPPAITSPANVTVEADAGQASASGVDLGTPVATDNCGVASVTSNAPAIFPLGLTPVTWTATDTSGNSATATQTVTVTGNPPVITTQPTSQSRRLEGTTTFSVTAIGTEPLSYQWRRNGVNLGDGGNVSGAATATLTLSGVSTGDAGSYDVVVTNPSGIATSTAATLTVMDPFITAQPASQSRNWGDSGVFSVTAVGTAPLAYQWRKNGVNLGDGGNVSGAATDTLTLSDVSAGDAGSYDVVVSSPNGTATSAPAFLILVDGFDPGAETPVNSLAVQADGKIVVGAWFGTLGGQIRRWIGRLNADGTLDASFNPGADNYVHSLAVQADGRILVGGEFTTLGGQICRCIGRLNADGSLDASFNPGADYSVNSLAVQADGKILVGGWFSTLGEQSRSYLGRLNADGTLDTSFNPEANSMVNSMAVQADGKIVVGGWFSTLGEQSRSYLGRLNADGTLDTSFNPGADSIVSCLAVQADGKIVVGGYFTTLGGQSRNYIGRLNADGSLDTSFNPGADSIVNSLTVQANGKIVVGGQFSTLGGQSRNYLGRLNADGSLDNGFNPGADDVVYSLAVQADGKVLAGGYFNTLGGQSRIFIGRLDTGEPATQSLSLDGTTLTWLRGGSGPEVWRTTFEYSIGAEWTSLGAGARSDGGWQWTGVSLPPNSTVRARGYSTGGQYNGSGGLVEYAMGPPVITVQPTSQSQNWEDSATFSVTATGTEPLSYQWRRNGVDLADGGNVSGAATATLTLSGVLGDDAVSYDVVVSNPDGSVTSTAATLTVIDPAITVQPASQSQNWEGTATFSVTAIGTEPLTYQWRRIGVDLADGGNVSGASTDTLTLSSVLGEDAVSYDVVVSNPNGSVTSTAATLAVIDPAITAQPTSQVQRPGDSATFRVAAVGTAPLSYQWRMNGVNLADGGNVSGATTAALTLSSVQEDDATRYDVVVSSPNGDATSTEASLTLSMALADGLNPGANGMVLSLVAQADEKILVGGFFSTLGGQSYQNIGRLNADGTLDASFNPGANVTVYSLAVQADGKILVGGDFTTLGGQSRDHIGRLNADGTVDADFNPGADGRVWSLVVQADGKILVGGNISTLGGQSRDHIGRLNADGSLDATFNPEAAGNVISLAVQTDGKILVGGWITSLGGQSRSCIGRLNADGTLDTTFNPGADSVVYSLAVQADGKILVGGQFRTLGGQSHSYMGRVNADGTVDAGFNPGADGPVWSLAVQADGKILAGGYFFTLAGQSRSYLGRLNADGTVDAGFNPGADAAVASLAVQADGKILAGGYFFTLAGQSRNCIGRLDTGEPATQSLGLDGTTLTWLRGGSGPEVWCATFDYWTGDAWTSLGAGTRTLGGWQLTGVSLPANPTVRAWGYTTGGQYNGSGGVVETMMNGNQPPVAKCRDVTVSAGANCLADAAVDDGSFDPDSGDTITLTQTPPGPYPLGATSVTLTVTDDHGASATCTATVTVRLPAQPVFGGYSVPVPGQFRLQAAGTPGLTYKLQTSTNLVDWVDHTNLLADPTGLIECLDNMQTDTPACFYRLRWP